MNNVNLNSLVFDSFRFGGLPFAGAVKIRVDGEGRSCCECTAGDTSVIAIYQNGACIDLWSCQGCICQQAPIDSVSYPDDAPIAIIPGALLPEEVCADRCYSRKLKAGSGGLSGAWDTAKPIGLDAIDTVALSLKNAELERQLATAKITAASPKTTPIETQIIEDPIAAYIREIESCVEGS